MRRRPKLEFLENRTLLASAWHNEWRPLDIDSNNVISAIDALVGINRLNQGLAGLLPARDSASNEPFFDTNGDGYHDPLDVLAVINALNAGLQVTVT